MVQGEKQTSMTTLSSSFSRSSDPVARKAGYEAVQRMDVAKSQSSSSKTGENLSSGGATGSSSTTPVQKEQYGSWGPMFQNKSNFASMHWC